MKKLVIITCAITFICFYQTYAQRLTQAAMKGNLEKAQMLIDNGANVNEHNKQTCYPLMYAVMYKNVPMVELLLKNGAKSDTCPRHHSMFNMSPDMLVATISQHTPFYEAIKLNQIEMVKLFYDSGYDISKKIGGPLFTYPAIFAAQLGYIEIFNFFLEKGVDVTVKDFFGNTALMYGFRANNLEMINYLINKGCSVNEVSKNGLTPLMYASQIVGINPEIPKLLVSSGANINFSNPKNQTAFSVACSHNNRVAALYLLEQGVKGTISETDDETNARMNLFLGEYYLIKGDLTASKACYVKSKEHYNKSLSGQKMALANVNGKKAGNLLLGFVAEVAVGTTMGVVSGGQSFYSPSYMDVSPNPYKKDRDNILISDYQISEKPSLDEQKVYCKNKIQQFEMSIKLVDGTLACMEKGLTGDELNTCIDNIQLTKKK